MKITRRDLGVIMILAGILLVFIIYKTNFEPTQAEIEQIQAEQQNIQQQINDLQPFVEAAPKYEKNMKAMLAKVDDILKEFPDNIWQEDNIMYVVQMLDDIEIKIPAFTAQPAAIIQEVAGEGAFGGKNFSLMRAGVNFSYTVPSYDDMKTMLEYVYDSDEDKTRAINNVTLTFGEEKGDVSGSISIAEYVITDDRTQYEEIELPLEEIGIENGCIFGEAKDEDKDKDKK